MLSPTHHIFRISVLMIKLNKGCNFDTTEVIEAESQAMLNTPHRTLLPGCI
jgi:hypothetical protein